MPILGIQQGISPIIGYNHGMKNSDRVQRALVQGIAFGAVFSVVVFSAVELWPSVFASLFIDPKSPTMAICVRGIRISFIMLTLLPINIIGSTYFQSTAQSLKAFTLSISRSVIFLIPSVLILSPLFGLDGVWFAQPVADFLSVTLTVILLLHSSRMAKRGDFYKV
jgi:Na+-driven multidrug efflux pump